MRASRTFRSLLVVAMGVAAPLGVASAETLTGTNAFTTWEQAAPGVRYLIKPGDLPEPFVTESASNAPAVVAKPVTHDPSQS